MSFYNDIFVPAQRIVVLYRDWYRREYTKYPLHPAVVGVLQTYRPIDWQRLLLEHPHRSETDAARLAYTRDERSGEANRQVVTTIGKYLSRHFDVPDHVIRDAAALYSTVDEQIKILDKVTDFIDAVQRGPHSCMAWAARDGRTCSDGVARHPYAVYEPAYGWHMAVRVAPDGDIVGRALLNYDNDIRYWVRSYKKNTGGGYSYADEGLEAWLKEQGYEHRGEWHEGAELALFELKYDGEVLAPYLDGAARNVTRTRSGRLRIDWDGEYECNNTDGTAAPSNRGTCPDCGGTVDEDDLHSTGFDGDRMVCEHCLDNDYTYVTGRRRYQYYVYNNDAVEADGNWYDCNHLVINSIVQLANGDYTHSDNAVLCEDDDEWYHVDDTDIIYCEYDSEYHHIDNCVETQDQGWVHQDDAWECDGSSNWYSDNTASVNIDGCTYHPDHTPEQETETNKE